MEPAIAVLAASNVLLLVLVAGLLVKVRRVDGILQIFARPRLVLRFKEAVRNG